MCVRETALAREREEASVQECEREGGVRESVCVCAIEGERVCDRQRVIESVCESASEGGIVRE